LKRSYFSALFEYDILYTASFTHSSAERRTFPVKLGIFQVATIILITKLGK